MRVCPLLQIGDQQKPSWQRAAYCAYQRNCVNTMFFRSVIAAAGPRWRVSAVATPVKAFVVSFNSSLSSDSSADNQGEMKETTNGRRQTLSHVDR